MARPIHEIADDVRRDWKNVYFGAVPYLAAMSELGTVNDDYGADSAPSIIRYFLANASGWRGPVAKQIKAELNAMVKGRYGATAAERVAIRHAEALTRAAYSPDGSWSDWPSPDPKAPKTIWGPAQDMYVLDRGVRWFSTAGHGGMAVADGVARKMLTPAAYRLGDRQWGYVWYEEDVAYAIPFYEHPEWAEVMARKGGGSKPTPESLERTIRSYYPKYFEMLEAGGTHPRKPKVGGRVRFERDVTFGSGTVVPAGTEATVFKVTGSMLYLETPSGYRVRMPVRDAGDDGLLALV